MLFLTKFSHIKKLKKVLKWKSKHNDLKKILEALSNLAEKKMSPEELSEAVRPAIVSLLIQRLSGINEPLNVSTFNADFEHVIYYTIEQNLHRRC